VCCRCVHCRQRSDPAVAVPARTASGRVQPGRDLVDWWWLGVPDGWPGRGGTALGCAQEQAQDELREAESERALLLRQEHHPQDARQAIRLQVRLWHGPPARLLRRPAVPRLRTDATTATAWRDWVTTNVHCCMVSSLSWVEFGRVGTFVVGDELATVTTAPDRRRYVRDTTSTRDCWKCVPCLWVLSWRLNEDSWW